MTPEATIGFAGPWLRRLPAAPSKDEPDAHLGGVLVVGIHLGEATGPVVLLHESAVDQRDAQQCDRGQRLPADRDNGAGRREGEARVNGAVNTLP